MTHEQILAVRLRLCNRIPERIVPSIP